jgi:hypothetical protein
MQISYFITERNVRTEMTFDAMRELFVDAGECSGWNWGKLAEALESGFTVVMPCGIEVRRA